VGFLLHFFAGDLSYAFFVLSITVCGLLFCRYLCDWLLAKDVGTEEMRAVSEPIREGSRAFLREQYGAIARIAVIVCGVIFVSYQLRPSTMHGGVNNLGNVTLGVICTLSFVLGAACSAAAGYVSMWVASQSNIRVASAARRGYMEALIICFRGGAFSAILVLAMCVMGITLLHSLLYSVFVTDNTVAGYGTNAVTPADIPLLTVGYGFGASFVALFMQLGGGIYTKAADVGADMVGKIEAGIPEDDPRNPAVIADLVGDMVGDCVGSSADIFESIAAEIIGAMILAGVLAGEARLLHPQAFVYFPIMVHAFDIVVSSVGIMSLGDGRGSTATHTETDPMKILNNGYVVSISLAAVIFSVLTRWLLFVPEAPYAWLHYLGAGAVGMATSYVFIKSTQYNTDYQFEPVRSIAAASTTGHGTNIIAGVAVGMSSTLVPVVMVSVSVLSAYWLGRTSGLGSGHNAGLFGTAVATMGMLSSAGYILAMNNYGPIADNAGGIAEMSEQPEAVRDATDRLDACGNVTKAITKGYSIGSAAMACFLLFGALMDEFTAFAGVPVHRVDIAVPEVMVGGLLGVMMVFYFVGLTVSAVGRTAQEVVREVRRQFKEYPGIMERTVKPDYFICVSIVTRAALREMRFPGLLTVCLPVSVGLIFRVIGEATGRPLLGCVATRSPNSTHTHGFPSAHNRFSPLLTPSPPPSLPLPPQRRGPPVLPHVRHRRRYPHGSLPRQRRRRVGQRQEVRRARQLWRQGLRGPQGGHHRRHGRGPLQGHRGALAPRRHQAPLHHHPRPRAPLRGPPDAGLRRVRET
jgi:H+-translocating diphosphatase